MDEYDDNDINENDIEYVPEQVRPPDDIMEWAQAVVAEYIYLTGKTLYFCPLRRQIMSQMVSQGWTPVDAALHLVEGGF